MRKILVIFCLIIIMKIKLTKYIEIFHKFVSDFGVNFTIQDTIASKMS